MVPPRRNLLSVVKSGVGCPVQIPSSMIEPSQACQPLGISTKFSVKVLGVIRIEFFKVMTTKFHQPISGMIKFECCKVFTLYQIQMVDPVKDSQK